MLYILWTKAFWWLGKQNVRSLQFSLWESFEGIYVDVSMGCSHPGTHRTLWWDELELRRSYGVQRQLVSTLLSSWCQSPLFALCPRPESKEEKCYSKFWLFPNDRTRLSISLFLECLVWNTDLLASGLSLASQGHTNQRLRAHTLTSQDARDRRQIQIQIHIQIQITIQIQIQTNTQIPRPQ